MTLIVETALWVESYGGMPPRRSISSPSFTLPAPKKACQNRLFTFACGRLDNQLGRLRRLRHRLRRQKHEHHIDIRVIQHNVKRKLVPVGQRITKDVYRVVPVGGRRELRGQLILGLVAEFCKCKALPLDGVRGHDARTSGIGYDRHAGAGGKRLVRKRLREIELLPY
ncbi:MAG: hypothetical protein JSU94_17645 [Phycisphaerales bacterium]|nr:MAG: hypothetical protein JSU94_17645 [Phycisphaerales bacterium]